MNVSVNILKRLTILFVFSTFILTKTHSEQIEILLPDLSDILRKSPQIDINTLGPQAQKKYSKFKKTLEKDIEVVFPILAGIVAADCKNINEHNKFLYPSLQYLQEFFPIF